MNWKTTATTAVKAVITSFTVLAALHAEELNMLGPWIPDLENGNYKNPVIHADYSDPDVVRIGSDYYMTSSSFNCTPGLQILHSLDLVNWKLIGKVFDQQPPYDVFTVPQPSNGVWAPSIRFHNEEFYITYGDPDHGIYIARAGNPEGPWTHTLVKPTKGWIDPCLFWDSDGQGYIVHAYANSRIGFKSILTIRRLSEDASEITDSIMVIDGNVTEPDLFKTVEGPKMYKKGSYYYIFAPAGGVTNGWQMVLRATDIRGPWEFRKVMEQGGTNINGPHQGGWVTTPDEEESWFLHFQDKGPYGRIVHLQPVQWKNDWPVIGEDSNNDGIGNPVLTHRKPAVGIDDVPLATPQTSDDFASDTLGLQWQWYANSKPEWMSLTASRGNLRLYTVALPMDPPDYTLVPNLLMQKLCADKFFFTTKMTVNFDVTDERAGVIVLGQTYSHLSVMKKQDGLYLTNSDTQSGSDRKIEGTTVFLRVEVTGPPARCKFEYSFDGRSFTQFGSTFEATAAKWIGGKIGIFASRPRGTSSEGYADFAWVNVDNNGDYVTGLASPAGANSGSRGFRGMRGNRITFDLPVAGAVSLSLYNAIGEKVKEIRRQGTAGLNGIIVATPDLAAGVYFYEIKTATKRIGKGITTLSTINQ